MALQRERVSLQRFIHDDYMRHTHSIKIRLVGDGVNKVSSHLHIYTYILYRPIDLSCGDHL